MLRTAALLLWALHAQSASASLVTVGGALSGHRGDTVSPTLFDNALSGFEGADFSLTYDPTYLSFQSALPGSADAGSFIFAGAPTPDGLLLNLLVSLATPGPITGAGSILVSNFLIAAGAPLGSTQVRFESADPTEYAFEPVLATINVLDQSVPLPIGNTGVLVAIALMALAATRGLKPARRR